MSPTYHKMTISWNSVIRIALLSVLLETLGSTADAACTKACDAGDSLSGSTCTSTVAASDSCPSGFSPSGGQCVDAGARCSGIISTEWANIGECCYGTKKAPKYTGTTYSCFPADGGPGGFYCVTSSTRGCYASTRTPSSCPSGSSADGNDCVRSLTYTCPSGYTRSGTTCTDTYAASTITTSTQCNRASPATDGCKWCSGVSACLPDAASCPASCLVMPQTTCISIPSTCQWCSAIGVCQKDSIGCFTSCLIATADSSICDASTSCKYCTGIGVCQPNGGVCYTSCLAATVEANVCEGSTSCKYCSTSESIGVCQPTGGICYTSCLAASAELAVCGGSDSCQWCATPTSIGVCQPKTGTCWATCPPATEDPLGSAVCSTSQSCKWCPGAAGGVGGIGVCQVNTGTCWASCLSATTDSSNADVCGYSTECKWCPSTTSIGVCQPNSGMCWPMCTPASDDPLGSGVCTTSADCKWCPTLGYCTEQTRNCHILCPTVAPDEPAICQVQSIQAQCQWCGAPGSVEYCVARTDEARLRCTASCSGLIWRQDVCNGALECHWCGVHNAAQGGRCKPLPGKSRGYVAWRREVECDTESESHSSTATTTSTMSLTTSATSTFTATTSTSTSSTITVSSTLTLSSTQSYTLTSDLTTTFSWLPSATHPNTTNTQLVTPNTHSLSETLSSNESASTSLTTSVSSTVSSSLTKTPTLTRTRSNSKSRSTSKSKSSTVTSATMSISYHLPPCNASHLETLAYVWPQLFNFTTNYSAVRQVGFPSILLTGDVRDPGLIYRVPQLLRREVLYHARPMYVTPVPYETPNVDGFVGRANTAPIELRWVSRTTLEVTMAPIGDYWLDTGERITIDVPFEEIELCNRTDPSSLPVPPTLQLVGVEVAGPRVDVSGSTSIDVVAGLTAAASMLTGDASSSSALQTLAVLAMSPCSQPTSKQSMSSLRALGPLPVGIGGYAGVVVGNLVIAASVALVQLVVIGLLMSSKRVGSFAEGCEKCRAPSMTIAAFFSFYQGTFYAASQLMARPGMDDGERGGGAVAFVFVFAAPFAVVWLCRTQLPRMCIAYEYQRSRLYHQLYAGPVAYVMLPQSRIEPAHLRRRFSTLVASYCKPHDLLPVLPVSIPFLLSILALWNPESNGECMTFFILALVIHVAVCIGVLVLRPFRLRYDLPLFSCGVAVNAAFVVLSIFALQDPRFLAPVVTFALLVVQIILQVVKMMLRLWNLRLEELLEAVPTYQTWVIGCSESADVKCGQVFSECDDNDVMNLLALTLMDGEGYGRHYYEDPTEDDNNPHSQLLQLLPIHTSASHHAATTASSYEERGASHSAAAAAAGDDTSSDGNELVMALGSLSKVDEELNLHDELRLWRSRDRTR